MAAPSYLRSPFGLVKRIKLCPPAAPTAASRIQQRGAGGASFRQAWDQGQGAGSFEEAAEEMGYPIPKIPAPKLDSKTQHMLDSLRMPRNVQAIYLRPLRRHAEHGIPSCDLQLRSYSVRNLEFMADFAMRAAYYLNLPAKGPVPLPRITERWTVPRSNFVHKKSQENFERITVRRLIQIQDGHPETVQIWLAFLEKYQFYGVGMKANVWEYERLGVGKRMDAALKEAQEMMKERWNLIGTRKNAATVEKIEEMLGDDVFKRASHGQQPMSDGNPGMM